MNKPTFDYKDECGSTDSLIVGELNWPSQSTARPYINY